MKDLEEEEKELEEIEELIFRRFPKGAHKYEGKLGLLNVFHVIR